MKTEVLCVSSFQPKQSYYIFSQSKESVRRFGVEPRILGWREGWHGLMTKPRRFREYLRKGQTDADVLIVADAWDVVFAAHPDEIAQKWRDTWIDGHLVFNAERNCFPRADLAGQFDAIAELSMALDGGPTPWKYLNSGFMVGTPKHILALLESMNLDDIPDDHQLPDGSWFNPNDQEHFTLAFLEQPVPMALDYKTELCIACHGSQLDEFDWSGERIVNKITGTTPLAYHFNGGAKQDVMPAVLEKLAL